MWFLYMQAAAVTLNSALSLIPSNRGSNAIQTINNISRNAIRNAFIGYAIFYVFFFSVSGEFIGIRWFSLSGFVLAVISLAFYWYGYSHFDELERKTEENDGRYGLYWPDIFGIASAIYSLIFIYFAATGR